MYNYGNPTFYQHPLYIDVPYYFDNRSYYNQYMFNGLAFHPMYNHWQFNMHNTHGMRQPVKRDRLNPGEKLLPGESLWSQNGQYALVMQTDGNLVQYKSGVALWASGTNGKKVDFAILQDDGNFVIYGGSGALWDTKTHGNRVAYLVVQDDGNIVIYNVSGKPVWASKDGPTGGNGGTEIVVLTKTLTSFHYPYTLFKMRKFRVYLEVKVPKKIAETMQSSLDNCMEVAKGKAAPALGGCVTVPTCMAAVSTALEIAVSTFTTCIAANPQLYPYIDQIKIDVKTDKNA